MRTLNLILITWLLVFSYTGTCFANGNDKFLHENVRWSQLEYQATAFFLTAETTINLDIFNKTEASKMLVNFDAKDLLLPEYDQVFRLSLFSDEFGKKTRYQIWFDKNGRALQRTRIIRGDKNQIKVTRYAQCGYYRLRKKFAHDNFDAESSQWDNVSRKYKAYPEASCDNSTIVDANSLLYLVSALDFHDVGDQHQITLEANGKPLKVTLVAIKKTSIKANYKITGPSGKNSVDRQAEVLKIQLKPMVEGKSNKESVKLLGLHGKIFIYLDLPSHSILRITGDTKYVDNIQANLKNEKLR